MRGALIGCGAIAGFHVSALQRAGVEVAALCDRDRQAADVLASGVPGVRIFTDAAELLAETELDAVHVLTPPTSHAGLATAAAEAGVHALVEKPFALSSEEVDAMAAAATRHGVWVVPHHNYLFKPSVRRARELVASGDLGDVVHVETYYGLSSEGDSYSAHGGGHWAYRLPGGAFTNFLPHVIYLQAAFLNGIEAVSGVAVAPPAGTSRPATELSVLLQGPDATGAVTISMRAQPYAKYVRVFGTKGLLHADLVGEVTTLHRFRRVPRLLSKALFNLEPIPQLAAGTAANSVRVLTGTMRNMPDVHAFVAAFYAALRAGAPPPASPADGRTVVSVMEEIWERLPVDHRAAAPRAATAPAAPRTDVERRIAQRGTIDGPVLVTGASGYVGRHVVAALGRCGVEARALVRDRSRAPEELEEVAEVVTGNVTDPASLAAAMAGASAVVHCAAVTRNKAPWLLHRQTNVEGTRAAIDEARRAGVRRLVHVSSVVVYGVEPSRRAVVGERDALPPEVDRWAFYQRSKTEAEQIVRGALGGTLELVTIRPGIVYGPGRPPTTSFMRLGSTHLMVGAGTNRLPYTYIDDVVDAILLALAVPEAAGETYNIVDAEGTDAASVARRRAELEDEPARLVPVPPSLLRAFARALERRSERAQRDAPPPLSRFHVDSAARDLVYDTAKAARELGWSPAVPLEEGLRRALRCADQSTTAAIPVQTP